jgi:hypothetical protein
MPKRLAKPDEILACSGARTVTLALRKMWAVSLPGSPTMTGIPRPNDCSIVYCDHGLWHTSRDLTAHQEMDVERYVGTQWRK